MYQEILCDRTLRTDNHTQTTLLLPGEPQRGRTGEEGAGMENSLSECHITQVSEHIFCWWYL